MKFWESQKKSLTTYLDNIVGILVPDHQTNGGTAEFMETLVNTSLISLRIIHKIWNFGLLVNEDHLAPTSG